MSFSKSFLHETADVISAIDTDAVERLAVGLASVREAGGRLFILGVGGSAAHASHAVNDFRKICAFESYTPTDNVSELTARANDEGWDSTFAEWLRGSHLTPDDALLVFSVGGGNQHSGTRQALETRDLIGRCRKPDRASRLDRRRGHAGAFGPPAALRGHRGCEGPDHRSRPGLGKLTPRELA